jgi:hypothetical protein
MILASASALSSGLSDGTVASFTLAVAGVSGTSGAGGVRCFVSLTGVGDGDGSLYRDGSSTAGEEPMTIVSERGGEMDLV